METLIYVIIAIFILLYIIDKKEPLPPKKENNDKEINTGGVKKPTTAEEKRQEVYKNIYTSVKEINPLKTYRVWTYIEIPNKSRNIQLSYSNIDIPVYFKKCIDTMKKNVPELIILTPLNIKEYLPDFEIEMKNTSELPLKIRIDILFATILENYGGLCISPGTIVYNVNKALSMLRNYEIVTFGGSHNILQSHNNLYYPNSYIIGSQKDTPFIQEYKRLLLLTIQDTYLYNFHAINENDIISYIVSKLKPTHFHFGTEYDGTQNSKLEKIPLSVYMGTYEIDFLNKEKLMVITLPYDQLFKSTKYQWFLNMSEIQFLDSNLELKNLLLKAI